MRARILLLSLSTALLLVGQVDTGTLTGVIQDSSGAAVAKAKVSIINTCTAQKLDLAADGAGLYVSPPLRPGEYTIEVEAAGFEKAAKRVLLDVAQRVPVDFDLRIGTLAQEVKVQDAVAVLQTETSTLSNLRTERAEKELPLNGRNFAQLIGLTAGVMPAQTQQSGSPIVSKRGVTAYSVNGMRWEENAFLVDGLRAALDLD